MTTAERGSTPVSTVSQRRLGGVGTARCDACGDVLDVGARVYVAVSRSTTGPWSIRAIRCDDCGPDIERAGPTDAVLLARTDRRPDEFSSTDALVAADVRPAPDVHRFVPDGGRATGDDDQDPALDVDLDLDGVALDRDFHAAGSDAYGLTRTPYINGLRVETAVAEDTTVRVDAIDDVVVPLFVAVDDRSAHMSVRVALDPVVARDLAVELLARAEAIRRRLLDE